MNQKALNFYQGLPGPVRSLVASLRGYQLRRRRYGADTDRLVAQALERERWSSEQWSAWQNERLHQMLHQAATQVPYYREQWANRRRQGDDSPWNELKNWPVLEKEVVRAKPHAFLAESAVARGVFQMHTSGTTGTPLVLWKSRDMEQAWYALFEARWRRWYGVSRQDRWAILGGQLVTPVRQQHPPFWVWNAALRQLYMSVYHMSVDLLPHYIEALKNYNASYLWGYTSALYTLAEEVVRSGRRDLKMTVVITNAEPLFDYQRRVIAQAFQCPVKETYGMAEAVAGASECEFGCLHLWPEAGLLEVVEAGCEVKPGVIGDFVCTGLLNSVMPLIRYRVGDCGALEGGSAQCACGRTLPRIAKIEGRSDDVLCTPDGRQIGRLDPVFKSGWPIREAQVIQESMETIRVRLVPSDGFDDAIQQEVARELRARLGNVKIEFEEVSAIPRGANGKFRSVICKLPSHQKPHRQLLEP